MALKNCANLYMYITPKNETRNTLFSPISKNGKTIVAFICTKVLRSRFGLDFTEECFPLSWTCIWNIKQKVQTAFPSQAPISRIINVKIYIDKNTNCHWNNDLHWVGRTTIYEYALVYIAIQSIFDECYYWKSVIFTCSEEHSWQWMKII